jgi:hypothetical protein
MAKRKFSTQLAGQIGEALVVAELGRRDIVATSFTGNVPDIDLLAYSAGTTLHLQVKSWRSGSVHLNAARFLKITMEGTRQKVHGIDTELDPELIYVFVHIGERPGGDNFFILTQGTLQEIVYARHSAYLAKHKGVRPRSPESTHMGLLLRDLEEHHDRWDIIEERLFNE